MAKHKTSRNRNKLKKTKQVYMEAREDLQLHGFLPTTPEGAIRKEGVDPSIQEEQPLPGLIGQAIRRGWAVPEERQPRLVDELMGIIENPEVAEVPKIMAYNALTKGDQIQYERDNPELAGRAKGKSEVNVQVVNDPFALYRQALEDVQVNEVEQQIERPIELSVAELSVAESEDERQQESDGAAGNAEDALAGGEAV